jgi:aldose 1-epimerase
MRGTASTAIKTIALKNATGMNVLISNHGARLVNLSFPDKHGKAVNVLLGFNSLHTYQKRPESYFGAVIGRFANRISGGRLPVGTNLFQLDQNESQNCLHGGDEGFDLKVFHIDELSEKHVVMSVTSPDGECGFPGNLLVRTSYFLIDRNTLEIGFEAESDRDSHINLTNHGYFNLNGKENGNVLSHIVQINSDHFVSINSDMLPDGKLAPVDKTPFDFRRATSIGARINDNNIQLRNGNGYNHTFATRDTGIKSAAARVMGDRSGILMEVFTTEPGIHFYTANEMTVTKESPYGFHSGFAMETQHFPDSPNQPNFPSTLIRAGQRFNSRTLFKFSH